MSWNLKYEEFEIESIKIKIRSLTFGELKKVIGPQKERKFFESNLLMLKFGIIEPKKWKKFPEKIEARTALLILEKISKLMNRIQFNPSKR